MSKRVVIIGAGVIGLSTAYYCARRGFDVTIVERKPAQRDGCSFGNAGMIVPSHFIPLAAPGMVKLALKWMWNPASPLYIKPRLDSDLIGWGLKFWSAANAEHVGSSAPLIRDLSLESRKCFEELAGAPVSDPARSGIGDFGLVKNGLLMLCKSEHGLHEEAKTAEQARALGVPAEVLDAKQTAALDPGARMDIAGSVHFPLDCHLTTDRFMSALQAEVERLGVKFIWESEVAGFTTGSARRIQTIKTSKGEELEADEFVLCGGSWSPQLARKLQLKIPLQAGKGYSLTLPKPRQLPQICSICTEARVAVTPMGEKLRVGGTMEIAGLNEDINSIRVRGIIDSFCRYFPEFQPKDFEGIQPWRGLRPCSPDGLPYLGRTAKFTNLSLATGHGMMGLSLGPITGKLMAEILAGEKPQTDIAMLSPDRYG
ncbi:MAG TPA: FAD-dependent oxidoreductase [Verrucomicrobiae bacterium]|nr:FAD-dependent oxidoreductase [Verrucomicrobiae bacterium]